MTLQIGLFGFGCVGQGLYEVLSQNATSNFNIKQIGVKDPNKKRSLPADRFTYRREDILNDPEIDIIVELIDDPQEAFHIVSGALKRGTPVVTANKRLLATRLPELLALQKRYATPLLYEAAACGSIPIIRTLEDNFGAQPVEKISGIFNGSTNYILSRIYREGLSYSDALRQAQELGFAETDPVLDVQGFDPKFKLILLTAHGLGLGADPTEVLNLGINNLSAEDLRYARERGLTIKLVAQAERTGPGKAALWVAPKLVNPNHPLAGVEAENNAVIVQGRWTGAQVFHGKGAGGQPTASAVVADLEALRRGYNYEYAKLKKSGLSVDKDLELEVYLRYTNPDLPLLLGFTDIYETVKRGTERTISGTVPLQNLLANQALLTNSGAFLAVTGEPVSRSTPQLQEAWTPERLVLTL